MGSKLPNLNQLSDHEFVLKVLEHNTPLMKLKSKLGDYDSQPKNRFKAHTGYYMGQLLNQIERVDQAGILMNSYPKMQAWSKRYGQFEYFQYHMEQYVIAVAGLLDRLFLLVNYVYELGYEDEHVRFSNIYLTLKKRDSTDLAILLDDLRKATHSIKRSKNHYTHLVRFWEKELWHIGVLEFNLRNETIEDKDGYLKEDLTFDTKLYRREKMALIINNEIVLLKKIGVIYNKIHREYISKLDSLPDS